VQVVDVLGNELFERIRNDLLKLYAGLDRDVGLRPQDVGGRHQDGDLAADGGS